MLMEAFYTSFRWNTMTETETEVATSWNYQGFDRSVPRSRLVESDSRIASGSRASKRSEWRNVGALVPAVPPIRTPILQKALVMGSKREPTAASVHIRVGAGRWLSGCLPKESEPNFSEADLWSVSEYFYELGVLRQIDSEQANFRVASDPPETVKVADFSACRAQ
jgi:hypothetical protein